MMKNSCKPMSTFEELFSLDHIGKYVYKVLSTFFLGYFSILRCQFTFPRDSEVSRDQKDTLPGQGKSDNTRSEDKREEDCYVVGHDLSLVMKRLGIEYSLEKEELEKKWGSDEVSKLFDDEPSLQEAQEAFDVFDQNKDGFIDAEELQRVLCSLGLRQGEKVESCREMIRAFDVDGDGKIDFNEFVRFMLNNSD